MDDYRCFTRNLVKTRERVRWLQRMIRTESKQLGHSPDISVRIRHEPSPSTKGPTDVQP